MPAVSFVADDLTGAADVLAQAHRYDLDAVLVVGGGDTPMPTNADVVGIAGQRARWWRLSTSWSAHSSLRSR